VRVERLDDYFARTGNIALSNGAKMSQQSVLGYLHVLGIRAWSAAPWPSAAFPGESREAHWCVVTSTNES